MSARVAAIVFLASTARVPLLTRCLASLTSEPHVGYLEVGGIAAVVARPRTRASRGTILFLNGGTALGCGHPAVRRVACGVARAGYTAVVPELPRLKDAELTPATLEATVTVARELSRDRRIGLFGVSAGGSLAILAAADPALAGRVNVVVALAPWSDLDAIVRLATTGEYAAGARATAPLVHEFVARSLRATAPLEAHERAVAALLANTDPGRYDALRAALPEETRIALDRLSPAQVVGQVQAPIELASAPDDGYFPLEEAEALAAVAPDARLTVSSLLDHVRLRPSLRDVRDVIRFYRFTARSLAAVAGKRSGGGSPMKNNIAEPARFLAVGTAGYVVNLLAFALLYAAGAAYAAASIVAYLVANGLMYIGNRYFTFRLGHRGFWSAYARYLAVGLFVAALTAAMLIALVKGAGSDPRLGQAVALLLVTPIAFVLFKRWTFRVQSR